MTYKPDIMLYHANCADGFGAAWAAWMRWGDGVQYVPASYGQEPPDVVGKHVLIGDFSYKRDVIERLGNEAASVVILDHHQTAKEELAPWFVLVDKDNSPMTLAHIEASGAHFPDPLRIIAHFDMNRSGARMVWDFCFPGEEAPLLIRLIEDRDLWRFNFEDTKPFGLWLRSEPFHFDRWVIINQELSDARDSQRLLSEAHAMQRFFDQKVSEIANLARVGLLAGHSVPLCNCPPMFASEVGHKLLDDYPEAPFVACYSDQGRARGYSLRSRDDRADVSEIAKRFGGGGHRNAAGFGVPLP